MNPQEGLAFIRFGPERVGHGQYLHPLYGGTNELWELAKEKNIPIGKIRIEILVMLRTV